MLNDFAEEALETQPLRGPEYSAREEGSHLRASEGASPSHGRQLRRIRAHLFLPHVIGYCHACDHAPLIAASCQDLEFACTNCGCDAVLLPSCSGCNDLAVFTAIDSAVSEASLDAAGATALAEELGELVSKKTSHAAVVWRMEQRLPNLGMPHVASAASAADHVSVLMSCLLARAIFRGSRVG